MIIFKNYLSKRKTKCFKKIFCLIMVFSVIITGCKGKESFEDEDETTTEILESTTSETESETKDNKQSSHSENPDISDEETKIFTELCDEIFAYEVTLSTIDLHYTLMDPEGYGIDRGAASLGNVSKDAYDEDMTKTLEFKDSLEAIDESKLSSDDQITYEILEILIDLSTSLSDDYYLQEFLSSTEGDQIELPILLAEYNFYIKQDVDDYIDLLNDFGRYFNQLIDFEKEKSKKGLFMSDTSCDATIDQCEKFVKNTDNNLLIKTFDERIDDNASSLGLTESEVKKYKEDNKTAVTKSVIPAYKTLISELKKLKGSGKHTGGICEVEGGKDFYETMVQTSTGSSMTIDEMAEKTKDYMESEYQKYIQESVNIKSWNVDTLTDPDEILKDLQEKIKGDFPSVNWVNYEVKYLDESLADYASPAFYLTPPLDSETNNYIYINSYSTDDESIYRTLTHEGYPGHLLQTNYFKNKGYHYLRSLLGTSGYVEGWATYVEQFSYKYSYDDEALANTYMHYMNFILGLYAISDMKVNYYDYSAEDLYDDYSTYGLFSMEDFESIFNYVVEAPGTYLNYHIGCMEINEMKSFCEDYYGNDFSLLYFNTFILDMGPAPFDIIKSRLTEYYNISSDALDSFDSHNTDTDDDNDDDRETANDFSDGKSFWDLFK